MPVGIRQNQTVEVMREKSRVEGRITIKTAESQHDYYFG
jgi:hypothetical protein